MLNRLRAWQQRQKQHRVADWAVKRKKGKNRFVVVAALSYGAAVATAMFIIRLVFREPLKTAEITIQLTLLFLGGLYIGHLGWKTREKEYLEAHPADDDSTRST